MYDVETLRRDCEKLRECYDAAIRERDAALAAAKSARWNAVFGCTVAVVSREGIVDMGELVAHAKSKADQAEECFNKENSDE
jgi:hypothetical protein